MTLSDPIIVILAGGQSVRMGGEDKALKPLAGRRMIDWVVAGLRPQAGTLLIAGDQDRGTGLRCVPDAPGAPPGPAAGLYSVSQWLFEKEPSAGGFITVPVDTPFLPPDLAPRLRQPGGSTIASDGERWHPTVAYWEQGPLQKLWPMAPSGKAAALHALARQCGARPVIFPAGSLLNINSPDGLLAAEKALAAGEIEPMGGV